LKFKIQICFYALLSFVDEELETRSAALDVYVACVGNIS